MHLVSSIRLEEIVGKLKHAPRIVGYALAYPEWTAGLGGRIKW